MVVAINYTSGRSRGLGQQSAGAESSQTFQEVATVR